MSSEIDYEGYILILDKNGKVFERLKGNTFWWTIGSLKGHKTEDIEPPYTILIKE